MWRARRIGRSWSAPQFIELIQSLTATIESLQHRIERLRVLENAQQLSLAEVLAPPEGQAPAQERQIAGYTRRSTARDAAAEEAESVPFFDESRVPVETIELRAAEFVFFSQEREVAVRSARPQAGQTLLREVRGRCRRLSAAMAE